MTTVALKLINTADRAAVRRAARGRRPLGQCLELAGILVLIGSSAAYAVFTLLHLA